MKIEVVIPVVQYKLALDLLQRIDENSVTPDRVIIINNGGKRWRIGWDCLNTDCSVYHSTTRRLNESWEVARTKLSLDCDYVTFLNDDIVIGNWFFQRTVETFLANENCGIAIPNIVDEIDYVRKGKARYKIEKKGVQACAFTIRKDVLDKVPSIPWRRVTTFYGDNWIWEYVRKQGRTVVMDLGNNIYHYVGKSILQFGFRDLKRPEMEEWEKIKQEGLI